MLILPCQGMAACSKGNAHSLNGICVHIAALLLWFIAVAFPFYGKQISSRS